MQNIFYLSKSILLGITKVKGITSELRGEVGYTYKVYFLFHLLHRKIECTPATYISKYISFLAKLYTVHCAMNYTYLAWTQISSKEVVFVLAPGSLDEETRLGDREKSPRKTLNYLTMMMKPSQIISSVDVVVFWVISTPSLIQESFPREYSQINKICSVYHFICFNESSKFSNIP